MNIIYLLIPIALVLVTLMAGILIWAVSSGQYDDLSRHGEDILDDDEQ